MRALQDLVLAESGRGSWIKCGGAGTDFGFWVNGCTEGEVAGLDSSVISLSSVVEFKAITTEGTEGF